MELSEALDSETIDATTVEKQQERFKWGNV